MQNTEESSRGEIKKLEEKLKSLRADLNTKISLSTTDKQDLKEGVRKNGRKYSVRNNRDRFFYPKEWFKFYDALNEGRQKNTFKFLINTGARINEARHVKVSDIDFDNKRMILRVTKVKAKKGETNSRPRIIPLSTEFTKWLRLYVIKNKLSADDYLDLLSTPAANICMKKTTEGTGIKDYYMLSIHNIRKTFENWLMALDIDGLKITAHLGHSVAVASGNYISPDVFSFEERKEIRMIIGDLYER